MIGRRLRHQRIAALTAALSLGFITSADAQPYRAIDIGTLGAIESSSSARAINDSGLIVGDSAVAGGLHAFRWTAAEGMEDLGTLGGANSRAIGVNEAGQIVGWAEIQTGQRHAFMWTRSGGMVDLGTLGGSTSEAYGLNESGMVVGRSANAAGQNRAFLWSERDGMVDLGTLGGATSVASAINDVGQIVGTAATATGGNRAFLREPNGRMTDLGTLGGSTSEAWGINNSGQVTGWSLGPGNPRRLAFIWTVPTGMVNINPGGGAAGRLGVGINASGMVIGNGDNFTDDEGPWVYANGRAVTLVGPTGMIPQGGFPGNYTFGLGLNDRGDAVGRARFSMTSATQHAIFWCRPAPPMIAGLSATPSVLAPADHSLATVQVHYSVITSCGASATTTLTATSNEPDAGTGAGDLPNDIGIVDNHTVRLRAERADAGSGRTYTIQVRVVDSANLEATQNVTVTVPAGSSGGSMTSVMLTTDVMSPQPSGATITLTAAGRGGTTPYSFRFWVQRWGGSWEIVRDWSTAPSFAWQPRNPGGFNLTVEARSSGGTTVEVATGAQYIITPSGEGGALSGVALSADLPAPQPVGTRMSFTAVPSGGIGPIDYRFWIQPWGGSWQVVREWSSVATFVWQPALSGGYNVAVEAREGAAEGSPEVSVSVGYWISEGR